MHKVIIAFSVRKCTARPNPISKIRRALWPQRGERATVSSKEISSITIELSARSRCGESCCAQCTPQNVRADADHSHALLLTVFSNDEFPGTREPRRVR
jgi:hypothetical protein